MLAARDWSIRYFLCFVCKRKIETYNVRVVKVTLRLERTTHTHTKKNDDDDDKRLPLGREILAVVRDRIPWQWHAADKLTFFFFFFIVSEKSISLHVYDMFFILFIYFDFQFHQVDRLLLLFDQHRRKEETGMTTVSDNGRLPLLSTHTHRHIIIHVVCVCVCLSGRCNLSRCRWCFYRPR